MMKFNGKFNDEIRKALYLRRTEMGLSCYQMAQLLGVNWCTYRKWEAGQTASCNTKFASRIEALLNGYYDVCALNQISNNEDVDVSDAAMNKTLANLGLTCRLVSEMPELSQQMNNRLEAAFQRAISAFLHLC